MCVCIYIYIMYIYLSIYPPVCVCVCVYIYIYRRARLGRLASVRAPSAASFATGHKGPTKLPAQCPTVLTASATVSY